MAAKTIPFPKGRGHLTHNNRDFICNNVVPERTPWNRTYIQESLKDAYEKCFGQALRDYNAAQKRKDRQKDDYLKEIENSGNKEKTFYENIVQIGKNRYFGHRRERGADRGSKSSDRSLGSVCKDLSGAQSESVSI